MLVGNHPFAADLAVANGRARPDLGSRAISPFSGKPVKTVTKGKVIARGDTQFTVIEADGTLEGRQPCLPGFPVRVSSLYIAAAARGRITTYPAHRLDRSLAK